MTEQTAQPETPDRDGHVIHYTVDHEPQTTHERDLTPTQILRHAGIDPITHYLLEIRGHERKSFKEEPNAEIRMHDHLRFVSLAVGPTPVS